MKYKDLDNRIKQLTDSYSELPDSDIWAGIEKGLARRRNTLILKRVMYYSAAAVVLIALVLFVPDWNRKDVDIVISEEIPQAVQELENVQPHKVEADIIDNAPVTKIVKRAATPSRPILAEGKDVIFQEENRIEDRIEVLIASNETEESKKEERKEERKERTIYDQVDDYRHLFADDTPIRRRNRFSVEASSNYIQGTGDGYGMSILPPRPLPGDSPETGAVILPSSDPKHAIPLKFGIGLQYRINRIMSIGTGVNLSILNSEYESTIGGQKYDIKQNMKYIGVPLNIYFDFINNNSLRLYGNVGGAMDKALGITYKYSRNEIEDSRHDSVTGIQWSARAGLGVEYRFNKFIGVYLDPSVAYYFESNQEVGSYPIRTIRSDRPLQFEFELGLRFSF